MATTPGSTQNHTQFALHNAVTGSVIILYSLFVSPVISPYSRSTPVEQMYGVDYLKDVVQVSVTYFWIDGVFALLNYVDGAVLLITTVGFLRHKNWAPTLTLFWSFYTIALAVVAVLVHYFFVAAPESQMLHDVTRHDAFDTRSIEITTRLLFFTSNWLAVVAVADAVGTLRYVWTNNLSSISDIVTMLRQWARWCTSRGHSLLGRIKARLRRP